MDDASAAEQLNAILVAAGEACCDKDGVVTEITPAALQAAGVDEDQACTLFKMPCLDLLA